jgi:hypothetical protein
VAALYQDVLGRSPELGSQFFLSYMLNQGFSRTITALLTLGSAEAAARNADAFLQ